MSTYQTSLLPEACRSFEALLNVGLGEERCIPIQHVAIKQAFADSFALTHDINLVNFRKHLSQLRVPDQDIEKIQRLAQNCIIHPRMYLFLEETRSSTAAFSAAKWDPECIFIQATKRIEKAFCRACEKSDAFSEFLQTIRTETNQGQISQETAAHLTQIGIDSYELSIHGSQKAHDHPKAAAAPIPPPAASQETHGHPYSDFEAIDEQLSDFTSLAVRSAEDEDYSYFKDLFDAITSSEMSGTLETDRPSLQNFVAEGHKPALKAHNLRAYDLLFPEVESPRPAKPSGTNSFFEFITFVARQFAPQATDQEKHPGKEKTSSDPQPSSDIPSQRSIDLAESCRTAAPREPSFFPVPGPARSTTPQEPDYFRDLVDSIRSSEQCGTLSSERKYLRNFVIEEHRPLLKDYDPRIYDLLFSDSDSGKSPVESKVREDSAPAASILPSTVHPKPFSFEIREYFYVLANLETRVLWHLSSAEEYLLGLSLRSLRLHLALLQENYFANAQAAATNLEDTILILNKFLSYTPHLKREVGISPQDIQAQLRPLFELRKCLKSRLHELREPQIFEKHPQKAPKEQESRISPDFDFAKSPDELEILEAEAAFIIPPTIHPESFISKIDEFQAVLMDPEVQTRCNQSPRVLSMARDFLCLHLTLQKVNFFTNARAAAISLENTILILHKFFSDISDWKGEHAIFPQKRSVDRDKTLIDFRKCLEDRLHEMSEPQIPTSLKEPVPDAATSSADAATTPVSYKLRITIPGAFFDNFRKLLSTLESSESTKSAAELLAAFERKNLFPTNDAALSELGAFLEKIRGLFDTTPEHKLVHLIKVAIAEITEDLIP